MTEKRKKSVYAGFNAQELFEFLQEFSEQERTTTALYIRTAPEGTPFNVSTLDYVEECDMGFFGIPLPCLILNINRFSPENPEDIEDEE